MGISWKDMAVSNLRSGQPVMALTGWAAERLAKMTPPGHEAIVHVTLTDDHPWAQAFVVIEARPLGRLPGKHGTPTDWLGRAISAIRARRAMAVSLPDLMKSRA